MTVLWRRSTRRRKASEEALIVAGEHLERTPGVDATPEVKQELVERLRDPETISRGLVRGALHEMEGHYWERDASTEYGCRCQCGFPLTEPNEWAVMRAHKEDVLANHLGLTIRPEVP